MGVVLQGISKACGVGTTPLCFGRHVHVAQLGPLGTATRRNKSGASNRWRGVVLTFICKLDNSGTEMHCRLRGVKTPPVFSSGTLPQTNWTEEDFDHPAPPLLCCGVPPAWGTTVTVFFTQHL